MIVSVLYDFTLQELSPLVVFSNQHYVLLFVLRTNERRALLFLSIQCRGRPTRRLQSVSRALLCSSWCRWGPLLGFGQARPTTALHPALAVSEALLETQKAGHYELPYRLLRES